MSFKASKISLFFYSLLILSLLSSCGRLVTECGGTPLNVSRLVGIEKSAFQSTSKAYLLTPNPLDATGNISVQSFDSVLGNVLDTYFLPRLSVSTRLENSFLKVRINSVGDDANLLAYPNSNGEFRFDVPDVHYGETMAYHSISAIQAYVEELGFQTNKSKPLFVMVRAQGSTSDPSEVNAFYDHNRFNPQALGRELKLFGETAHAPRQDRDIYWHEFGHYFLESITLERGIDDSGDRGAIFSEGAAIHECLADYGAESLSNRGYIGRWVARNFSEYPAGTPLRSAEKVNDDLNNYNQVNYFNPSGTNLDRYRLGEWCSRVLWDIRTQIVTENSDEGRFYADRTIFSAASILAKNSSVTDLKSALLQADEELNCGIHQRSISQAFQSRGFSSEVSNLQNPLTIKGSLSWLSEERGSFAFNFVITNPNPQSARNVRLVLESPDGSFSPVIPQQSYGDLGPGRTITVGTQGALPIMYSVKGAVDLSRNYRGTRYLLKVKSENGQETIIPGAL
ncbi:MAG: hypothetical protein ACKOA8_17025 [Deltaproteobacteria bacterium]